MYKNRFFYWEHGILLQPQHFQILEKKTSYYSQLLTTSIHPYMWGFKKLQFSQEAFANGTIALETFDLITKDGEHLVLGENAYITPRTFNPEIFADKESVFVYLSVPIWDVNQKNVTECDTNKNEQVHVKTRYYVPYEPSIVPDAHSSGPVADIRFITYNGHITFETETDIIESSHYIPIARIIKDGDLFTLDADYIPPCVDILAFSKPNTLIQNIKQVMQARVKQLEEYKLIPSTNDDSHTQTSLSTYSLTLYFMLNAFSKAIPKLEHICELQNIHPWDLYGILREILGELSMFSSEVNCFGRNHHNEVIIPAYSHTNLSDCFLKAHDLFIKLTAVLITGPAHSFKFDKNQETFLVNVPMHIRSLPYTYWLQVRTSGDIATVKQNVIQRAKLASPQIMPSLVTKSLSGIALHFSEKAPSGLPRRDDTLYFYIDMQNPLWQQSIEEGDIALFLPQFSDDGSIHLILVNN